MYKTFRDKEDGCIKGCSETLSQVPVLLPLGEIPMANPILATVTIWYVCRQK